MTTPYVDPQAVHNPSTGASPPAAWGDTVRDGLEFLARPPGCIIQRSALQSVATGTPTSIQFTAADLRDTDNYHSPSSNPERITIPTGLGGWYWVMAQATFSANSVGRRLLTFRINGTGTTWVVSSATAPAGSHSQQVQAMLSLSAGDYVDVTVQQDSGGALNLTSAYLTAHLVSV